MYKKILIIPMAIFVLFLASAFVNASEPAYTYVYVNNAASDTVSVIDTVTLSRVTDIKVNGHPDDIIVSPSGTMLYVSYSDKTFMDVYSTINYAFIKRIQLPGISFRLAINDQGTMLYASLLDANKVICIDTTTYEIVYSVSLTLPFPINYYNGHVYVNSYNSTSLTFKFNEDLSLDGYLTVANNPWEAKIYSNTLYVSSGAGTVEKIDLSTFTVSDYFTTGAATGVNSFALNNSGFAFVVYANASDYCIVALINPSSKAILANYTIGKNVNPYGILSTPYNHTLYICGYDDNNLYMMDDRTGNITAQGFIGYQPYRVVLGIQSTPASQLVQFKLTTLGYLGLDGVPTGIFHNGNLVYSGITDGNGIFACYLNPSSTYTIWFNSSANGVNASYDITVTDLYYQFDQDFLDVVGGQFSALLGPIITPDVFGNQSQVEYHQSADMDQVSGTGFINGTYVDYSGHTINLAFNLYGNNSTYGGNATLLSTQYGGASGVYNFTIANAADNDYYVEIVATHSSGIDPAVGKYYPTGVHFPGVVVLASTGIRLDWLFYIGLAIPLFLWGAGVYWRRGYMGLVGTIAAGIIAGWCRWYVVYIPDLLFWSAFAACFLLSIGVIIIDAEKARG